MNLAPIEAVVRDRIGLDPASLGSAAFRRAVEGRMRSLDIATVERYAHTVVSDPAAWSDLLGDLLVPETWFFRGGRPLFEYLARLVRERSERGRVRILSAPCSTGEEPYSLAVAIDEQGVSGAEYEIDAVDLSASALHRAATGRYPAFSFREAGPDPRPRYFQPTDDGRWGLCPDIRETVRFRPGNLVEPGFLAAEPPYDLILCRNLFIYLTPEARAQALANLDRLLALDGRLGLTPAEADRLPGGRFLADGPVGLSIFRRATKTDAEPQRLPIGRIGRIPAQPPTPPSHRETATLPTTQAAASPVPLSTRYSSLNTHDEARLLADAGKLDEARAVCERSITASPTASLFSLLGVIHLAAGRPGEAAAALRKALYLDPDHTEALMHMAVLCEQRGESAQAAGLRRRLARTRREETA